MKKILTLQVSIALLFCPESQKQRSFLNQNCQ